jgi:hypothetical protein
MRHLVVLLLLASGPAFASPLFENDEVLEITLEGPLSTAIKDTLDRDEYPFVLAVDSAAMDVGVRVRGVSRVQVCNFPPLRLSFASSDMPHTVFSDQEKLKLVTHCRKGADFEQNVLEEYAAYRIFNVLSDVSYRTRLVRIRYVDTSAPGNVDMVRYAFFIESSSALAERLDGTLVNTRQVTKNFLDEQQASLTYIFHYLIGNTDWSLVRAIDSEICCHNGLLVGIDDRQFYVPYDFDRAGLVNARYAKPHPDLRLRRVTQRRYRGYCGSIEALKGALQTIVRQHDDIIRVIEELPRLSEKDFESPARYLEGFFESAADEDKLLRKFERRCL